MPVPNESILTQILEHKQIEVARQCAKIPLGQLETLINKAPPVRSFADALRRPDWPALIAEVKKASPSRGVLIENFDPLALAQTYATNGARAISVLTDQRYFQGSLKYLEGIRSLNLHTPGQHPQPVPLLRKDFLVDAYQVYEARAYGADAVLLIAAALDQHQLAALLAQTHALGMQALVEVHDQHELVRALAVGATIIGINNRNLHTFETSLNVTEQLAAQLPTSSRPLLVSESGIFTPTHARQVHGYGANAILVGEALVTAKDIGARVRDLAAMEAA